MNYLFAFADTYHYIKGHFNYFLSQLHNVKEIEDNVHLLFMFVMLRDIFRSMAQTKMYSLHFIQVSD